MRYSFHGKVRATGQTIDGFIEAETASIAIDRLADKGIIGVYSVRPDPKPPKPPGPGDATPARLDARNGRSDRRVPKALPNGTPNASAVTLPAVAAIQPIPGPATTSTPAEPAQDASTSDLLKMLVDKVASLTGKVETMLKKPASVVYQQGPTREAKNGPKRLPRVAADLQNSTLRDIFQNNLDLRHSLEKLATTVGPGPNRLLDPAPRETNGANGSSRDKTNGTHDTATNGHQVVNQAQPA